MRNVDNSIGTQIGGHNSRAVCASEARQTQVSEQMSDLNVLTEELEKQALSLVERISAVLRPDQPEPCREPCREPDKQACDISAPLASHLRRSNESLRSVISLLRSATARVEI